MLVNLFIQIKYFVILLSFYLTPGNNNIQTHFFLDYFFTDICKLEIAAITDPTGLFLYT